MKFLEEKIKDEYPIVKIGKHSKYFCMADYQGWIPKHRYICAIKLGRPISNGYDVHHIDLNKTNCKKNNLIEVISSVHIKFHRQYNWQIQLKRISQEEVIEISKALF